MRGIHWLQLILPLCTPQDFLALRLVCRHLKQTLTRHDARVLWRPYTMLIPRLTYAERVQGWDGVLLGMRREERTKRCVRPVVGPVLKCPVELPRHVYMVAGRLIVLSSSDIYIYESNKLLTRVVTGSLEHRYSRLPVLFNRFLAFLTLTQLWILDCVTLKPLFVPGARAVNDSHERTELSASGNLLVLRREFTTYSTCVYLSPTHDSCTFVVGQEPCLIYPCNRGNFICHSPCTLTYNNDTVVFELMDESHVTVKETYVTYWMYLKRITALDVVVQVPHNLGETDDSRHYAHNGIIHTPHETLDMHTGTILYRGRPLFELVVDEYTGVHAWENKQHNLQVNGIDTGVYMRGSEIASVVYGVIVIVHETMGVQLVYL